MSGADAPERLLAALETGEIDPATFSHRDHIAASWAALRRYEFFDALLRVSRGLRNLAERASQPQKFNATITFAFFSAIAERMQEDKADFETFAARNGDLAAGAPVRERYDQKRLTSVAARETALLP